MNNFKVGDWVTNLKDQKIEQIDYMWRLNQTKRKATEEFLKLCCKPWQPKEGEWCWFWDGDINASPLIGKYGYLSWTEQFYSIIEPFIGDLPSFLKEK